jgi:uncharacterized protein YegJ (DUF2314 family)
MKRIIIYAIIMLNQPFLFAQVLADFEGLITETESYLNGSSGENSFISGEVELKVDYNPEWDAWIGWALSNITDNENPGFINQFSAIPGSGAESGSTYAVSYCPDGSVLYLNTSDRTVLGMYITNSTYAYFSMLNGDAFAKKFGGESGNDPDYFSLTIKGVKGNEPVQDSVTVFLADYRFEDNSEDYILDEWLWVDLAILGQTDSLLFKLHSSDTGGFGINTPTYFCIDQVYTENFTSGILNKEELELTLLSNPVDVNIVLQNFSDQGFHARILNSNGMEVGVFNVEPGITIFPVEHLTSGYYSIQFSKAKSILFIRQ